MILFLMILSSKLGLLDLGNIGLTVILLILLNSLDTDIETSTVPRVMIANKVLL